MPAVPINSNSRLNNPEPTRSNRLCAVFKNTDIVRFDHWMNAALYAPDIGYYTTTQPVGSAASGADFTTAPELSPIFGHTIAQSIVPCLEMHTKLGLPLTILECGAGTGALAASVIDGLAKLGLTVARYNILEISTSLRAQQAQRLAAYDCVRWLDALPDVIEGVVLANELLDAMPVRAFTLRGDALFERGVRWDNDAADWAWAEQAASSIDATTIIAQLPEETRTVALDAPYCFEVGEQAQAWVSTVSKRIAAGRSGAMLLIDYGFAAPELYHPQRSGGTLMAHRAHRASTDVLAHATQADITAHVNFSALAQAAVDAGLTLAGYTHQARFLINAGIANAYTVATAHTESKAQGQTQSQTQSQTQIHNQTTQALQLLMSEAEMGELFKVIAFTHHCSSPLGFERGDRSHRLIESPIHSPTQPLTKSSSVMLTTCEVNAV